jgi:TonB family protein
MQRTLSLGVICAVAALHGSLAAQSASTAIPPVPPAALSEAWPPPGVVPMCHCDRDPILVKDKKPHYTTSAMNAKIQGTVEVEAVVETNGKVSDVRVVHSLDKVHGLDDEAVKAVKQWKFKMPKGNDPTAPVLVKLELSFWLARH